jgi:hypothetical protein
MSEKTQSRWSFFDYRILMILAIFAILNPSESDHENKVYYLYGGHRNSEKKVVKYTTRINFVFFSVTEINSHKILRKETLSEVIGVGILGNVFIFKEPII